jgi:hypothetical protein
MGRTTIVAPDDLLERLRQVAAERGTSVASIIREALEQKVRNYRPLPPNGPRRLPRSLGMGDSGRTDISRRIGDESFVPEPWR